MEQQRGRSVSELADRAAPALAHVCEHPEDGHGIRSRLRDAFTDAELKDLEIALDRLAGHCSLVRNLRARRRSIYS